VLPNSTLLILSDAGDDISADDADARLRLSPQTTWRRVTYRVRPGDTLSTIARRWHITMKSIVTANRLRSDRLRAGQRLILTVPNVERAPIQQASRSTGSHKIHAVSSGETLSSIARRYGVSVSALRTTNRISGNVIRPGQRLRIPGTAGDDLPAAVIYTVRQGDALSTIAQRFGTTVTKLKRANRLTNNTLRVGQRLEIPDAEPARAKREVEAPKSEIYVVRQGDTLSEIADRYGVGLSKLRAANGLRGNAIRIGQRLVIPATRLQEAASAKTHVVRSGDTLSAIARRYGTSVSAIQRANGMTGSSLRVGERLKLP
jgi:membrane-bound lytic murein transglycosylase D